MSQFDQRHHLYIEDEIVKCDRIPFLGKFDAGRHYIRGGQDILQDFNNNGIFGKEVCNLLEDEILGEINEAQFVACNFFNPFRKKGGG